MANISITTACNRDCAYCFAGMSAGADRRPVEHMVVQRFEEALDFLQRSGIPEARLLGGEPTLHPQFGRIVDLVVSRGLNLVLFTGGLIPEPALEKLESLPVPAASLLLNAVAPSPGRPLEPARLDEVCRRLGPASCSASRLTRLEFSSNRSSTSSSGTACSGPSGLAWRSPRPAHPTRTFARGTTGRLAAEWPTSRSSPASAGSVWALTAGGCPACSRMARSSGCNPLPAASARGAVRCSISFPTAGSSRATLSPGSVRWTSTPASMPGVRGRTFTIGGTRWDRAFSPLIAMSAHGGPGESAEEAVSRRRSCDGGMAGLR